MSGFVMPETLEFVGWKGNFFLMRGATRHDFDCRADLNTAREKLRSILNRTSILTEAVYVGKNDSKYFAYWFGTDGGKDYVFVLEFEHAEWLDKLSKD